MSAVARVILIGPREQRFQIDVNEGRYGDVRRRAITIRPACRVLAEPEGVDALKLQIAQGAQASWQAVRKALHSWRELLDHPRWRAVYRLVRRAKLELWLAVEEDRRWLQIALIALAALIVYAIVVL